MSKEEMAFVNLPLQPPRSRRLSPILLLPVLFLILVTSNLGLGYGWPSASLLFHNTWQQPKAGSVKWLPASSCNAGTKCGSVIVPKDYFDESAGTASIAISVLKATKLPKKGTVFLNPGGPGGSGTRLAAPQFADIIGHDWDLLGFDPRGINMTSPRVACFDSQPDFGLFNANSVLEKGFTISTSNLSDPVAKASVEGELIAQAREFLALKKAQAQVCAETMGDELKYMGTANVVRDMDFMTQIFDGKGAKINYWGASYGSILGAYLVNMLPHRVGYVVIDGIADPVNWSTEPSHKWPINWLASTEKTYRFYLETCSKAGPARCPIVKYQNEPYTDIMARIESFFDDLAVTPLPVTGSGALRPGILTSGSARALLLMYLERPPLWAESVLAYAEAMRGNGTILYNKLTSLLSSRAASNTHYDLVRLGVTCMDSPPPLQDALGLPEPTAEDLAAEFIRTMDLVSPHFGPSVSVGEQDGGCQYWPTAGRGPERFTGPWNASFDDGIEIPMLIVSNTMDPITPIESGLRINSLMPESSRIIIQDGPGHCSLAITTLCTAKLVRDYYAGKLPENGTICATDYDFFPPKNETEVISMLSTEDARLLESTKVIGSLIEDIRQR
ncbi:hypothetical protein MIND_01324400 [Mycena indigotica]|uniref:Alpha/beta-hydrolase n=1 Tax=Mycena indigotica TaxID=2126181 RepID=A0A8H6S2V4_9AGAR|nr:uncharacterized protein MIND_01324400 [Mycena indigotica]KAF7290832.1 hypothetical protein MIND_01324400 [Mycena indigotica]